jgi:hypothetical protein
MSEAEQRVRAIYSAHPGLTRTKIAAKAGCSKAYVTMVLSGQNYQRKRDRTAERMTERDMRKPIPLVVQRGMTPKPVYDTCVKWKYQPGAGAAQCGNPSDGHPYCPQCMREQSVAPVGTRYSNVVMAVAGMSYRRASAA